MFDYRLPSFSFSAMFGPAPLLTSIEVNGPYVTLYCRKEIVDELNPVLQMLQWQLLSGREAEHTMAHDNFFSKKFADIHFHLKLPNKSLSNVDKPISEGLTELVTALFHHQNPEVRKKEYEKLQTQFEEEIRRCYAPRDVLQSRLAQFDTTAPFFLETKERVIEDLCTRYKAYIATPSLARCRELISMYIVDILRTNSNSIRRTLLEPLEEIHESLKIDTPESRKNIQRLIKKVNVAARSAIDADLQMRLEFVSKYTKKSIAPRQSTLWQSILNSVNRCWRSCYR